MIKGNERSGVYNTFLIELCKHLQMLDYNVISTHNELLVLPSHYYLIVLLY